MRVTDPSYYLPHVLALEPGRIFTSGANMPLLIRGFCEQTASEGEYVLKGKGGERMTAAAFEREMLGCFAAWQVGLNAVEPVLVTVGNEFLQTIKGHPSYDLVSRSIGHNYGSVFRPGMREFANNQSLNPKEQEYAKLIFAFDVLIQNTDRRLEKQNMLTDGNDVIILDHELAFSFTQSLFPVKESWLIPEADLYWIRNHYFFNQLRGKRIDFNTLCVNFQNIDADFWHSAYSHIPPEWQTGARAVIENHINEMVAHVEEFAAHLNRITST
ncbi:hypothetical protein Q5H93_13860 [Hymenobacter sp. ASUV-10]|uniref:HipA-like kinase domain-containing protein n=1 Tax=Hymenobacter aranciens TaxID=3063996 RepID=A0ABT9BC31_9BACT|nr:HipA family kinase [Hymenobacter sp. ASUV-10]MDO7875824.1 hypothetical protein [Hymenobacter sp. ASUV-10]